MMGVGAYIRVIDSFYSSYKQVYTQVRCFLAFETLHKICFIFWVGFR